MTRSFLKEWLPFADAKGLQITMNNSQFGPPLSFQLLLTFSKQDVEDTPSSTRLNMPNSPRYKSVGSC